MKRDQLVEKLRESRIVGVVLIAPNESKYREVVELVSLVKEADIRDISLSLKLIH